VDPYFGALGALRAVALLAGAAVIFAGIARGAVLARGAGGRARAAREIGGHAALGLDLFVGATLLNLAINATLTAAAMTAITIVVRKLLTYAIGLGTTTDGSRSAPTGS
jgi:uncharacterized membrane protein